MRRAPTAATKRKGRGGARPGAGRKRKTVNATANDDRARLGEELLDAIRAGETEVVTELLSDKADVDYASTRGGTTALSTAAGKRRSSLVDLLLSHGAKVDRYQGQALQAAVDGASFHTVGGATDLDLTCVSALLQAKADPNIVPCAKGKSSALHTACHDDTTAGAIPMLLDAGADIELRDELGRTPLFQAAYHGSDRCFQLLHSRGAKLLAKDIYGYGVEFEFTGVYANGTEEINSAVAKGRLAIQEYLASQRAARSAEHQACMAEWLKAMRSDASHNGGSVLKLGVGILDPSKLRPI